MKTNKNEEITVVYICHDLGMGGAALSLVNLIKSVSLNIKAIVLMRKRTVLTERFIEIGCDVLIYNYSLDIANRNPFFRFLVFPVRYIRDYCINRRCISWVSKQLEGKKIDIVHTNSSVVSFGVDLAKTLHAKHIWHIREFMDLDFNMKPLLSFKSLKKDIMHADAVIAITHPIFEKWELGNHVKSYVIPDAVRSVSDSVYFADKEKYVLFCSARLSDNKGADSAADIFCRSHICDRGYHLYYIGKYNEDYKEKLLDIAREYGQEDYFVFLGYQSDIRKFMVKASAFMMCSKFEGLGRVTIEAMFYGCPVLGHNTGGTKEVIAHDITGLLYNTADEAVVMLRKLIDDKAQADRLTKNAADEAKLRFSEEEYGKRIMDIYRQVLK